MCSEFVIHIAKILLFMASRQKSVYTDRQWAKMFFEFFLDGAVPKGACLA